MKRLTLTTALVLGLVLLGSPPVLSAGGQGNLVQLRVSVLNSSRISRHTIERAEGVASRVVRDAGVELIWLNCPQDTLHEASLGRCSEASFPWHFHLGILSVSRGLKSSTLGISFSSENGEGCYADLFSEPIKQLQEQTHVSSSVILGHSMAHELGHLLLGTDSHSPNGLMRAHWTGEDLAKASKGNLRFSNEESLRIMNRLAQKIPKDLQTMVMTGH
jgi:hypothetical protein